MIRENIRKAYKATGISQAALARNIGMSRQRLSRLMNTEEMFTVGVLDEIAVQCGVTLAELLGHNQETEAQDKLNTIKEVIE